MRYSFLLVTLIISLFYTTVEASVLINLESDYDHASDSIDVNIFLSNSLPVKGLQFTLNQSPPGSILYNRAEASERISDWNISSNPNGDGQLFICYSPNAKLLEPGEGSILKLKFSWTPELELDTVYIVISDILLSDSLLQEISDLDIVESTVQIYKESLPTVSKGSAEFKLNQVAGRKGENIELELSLWNSIPITGFEFKIYPLFLDELYTNGIESTERTNGWNLENTILEDGQTIVGYSPDGKVLDVGDGSILRLQYEINSESVLDTIPLFIEVINLTDSTQFPIIDIKVDTGYVYVRDESIGSVSIELGNSDDSAGDTIEVNLLMGNSVSISMFDFTIACNPRDMVILSKSETSERTQGLQIESELLGDDIYNIRGLFLDENCIQQGDGTILKLKFSKLSEFQDDTLKISLMELALEDSLKRKITNLDIINRELSIFVENTNQNVSCDFNQDGVISIADVIALLIFQKNNPNNLAADFNQDGLATISDAISMLLSQRNGLCP